MFQTVQRMVSCLLIALCCFAVPAYSIEEGAGFHDEYVTAVMPFLDSFETGQFAGVDGKRISYAKHEVVNEAGAIVILTGMSESYVKYAELMYDLRELGYSYYVMDHRGFGRSERLLSDPKKNYVVEFNDYVDDVKFFMDTVVNAKPHAKIFLIAHSMGGGIAARYLGKYPRDITAAVLCAPMLHVNTGDFPEFLAYPTLAFLNSIGLGKTYAPGHAANTVVVPFAQNKVTHSLDRWSIFNEYLASRYSELVYGCQLQGDTVRFCKEMMDGTFVSQFFAWGVTSPVLMFQAGQDSYVKPFGQNMFAAHAKNCTVVKFPTAKHEILMETDEIRDYAIQRIIMFIEAN